MLVVFACWRFLNVGEYHIIGLVTSCNCWHVNEEDLRSFVGRNEQMILSTSDGVEFMVLFRLFTLILMYSVKF